MEKDDSQMKIENYALKYGISQVKDIKIK